MVELAAPTIVPPLTPYVSGVRLQGLVPNSPVEILANGLTVATGTATSTDQWFSLGVNALKATQAVTARQGTSTISAPVYVLSEPKSAADIPSLSLVSHSYKCANSTWVDGAYPGSKVTIVDTTNATAVRGTITTDDADARLSIGPPLDFGPISLLRADVHTGKFQKNAAVLFPVPPLSPVKPLNDFGGLGKLPTPRITKDLHVCQSRVPVEGAIEGATVVIRRYGLVSTPLHPKPHLELVAVYDADFDYPALWVTLPRPVQLGDEFSVQQVMPSCGLVSDESQRYTVRDGVPAPTASPIVCAKDRVVSVGGLILDALVELGVEGSEDALLVMGASSDPAPFPVPENLLVVGMRIRFRQTLSCLGVAPIVSDWSPSIDVLDGILLPTGLGPKIDPEPWSCGRRVRVHGVTPGSIVHVVSKFWGGRFSNGVVVPADGKRQVDVSLFWGAMAGDMLAGEMEQCGQSVFGTEVQVLSTSVDDALRVPFIESPVRDCGPVIVHNVVPGSRVDVYRIDNGLRTLQGTVTTPLDRAYVDAPKDLPAPPFPIATTLVAQARACGRFSPMSNPASMVQGQVTATAKYLDRINGGSTQWFYGLAGMDLGIPVEHNGELLLFFGDSSSELRDKTAFKSVARASPLILPPFDEPVSSVKLEFMTYYNGSDIINRVRTKNDTYPDLSVAFQVPTGGFSFEGRIYLFVSETMDDLFPEASGVTTYHMMARSWLISAASPTDEFDSHFVVDAAGTKPGPDPSRLKFINVCPIVVDESDLPSVPGPWTNAGPGVLLFGSGSYRNSDVFLAWAPLRSGKVPALPSQFDWLYYTGDTLTGPTFEPFATGGLTHAVGLLDPSAKDRTTQNRNSDFQVGEFSVAWVPGINRWLMLYGGIGGATAPTPWGPWSPFLDKKFLPLGWRELLTGVVDAGWDGSFTPAKFRTSGPGSYGTYLLPRYTRWDSELGTASVYTVFSLMDFNAGTVHLARIDLTCAV